MIETTLRRLAATALVAGCVVAAPPGAMAEGETAGPVLLTVTGTVGNPNRPAMDPDTDKLFVFNGAEFETAYQFDLDALKALPQASVRADFPAGGKEAAFAGPTLAEVLAAAGAEGRTVTVQALDGYAVEAPLDELVAMGAVVALEKDGVPFGIGSFGPAQIVFPRAERAELGDMSDDLWVWQVYHIRVE